jgi:hypothetical protein
MKKKLPLILIIFFLIVAVAAGAYFFSQKDKPKLTKTKEQKAAVKEMLANCKYDKDFCDYMAAQAKAMETGVIISTSTNIKNYGLSTSEMKLDKAGNMEISSYRDGKIESTMIIFDKITYFKNLDGSWYAMNVGNEQNTSSASSEAINEIKNTYSDENQNMQIKKVATEPCGSLTCDKYEIIGTQEGDQKSTIYTWVDTKEHLARKTETTFNNVISTMEYKYESVNVSKPSPIKELPLVGTQNNNPAAAAEDAGVGVDPAGQIPSQEEIDKMMKEYSLDGQ